MNTESLVSNKLMIIASSKKARSVLELVKVFGSAGIFISIVAQFTGDNPLAYQTVIFLGNMLMVGLIWHGLSRRNQTWKEIGLVFRLPHVRSALKLFLRSLIVCLISVTAFVLGAVLMAMIVGQPQAADLSDYGYLSGNIMVLIGTLIAVWIGASFAEEVIYRGFLIHRLEEMGMNGRRSKWVAVFISSVVFGLIHFAWGPVGIVQAGFMGLALGISYLFVKRNLWVLILAHGYMDTILILGLYFNNS